MRMCIDQSCRTIWRLWRENPDIEFMQLRTPLTQYAIDDLGIIHYGLDNGAFTEFDSRTFTRMALKAKDDPLCDWIVMPDMVGDAGSTSALFDHWVQELDLTEKRAYALQDGATLGIVPFDKIECLFIGGTDHFKESRRCMEIVEQAKQLEIWVHVGRGNTPRRIVYWDGIADSFDGSGVARFSHMTEAAISTIRQLMGSTQTRLEMGE